jgi:hypothetical protein
MQVEYRKEWLGEGRGGVNGGLGGGMRGRVDCLNHPADERPRRKSLLQNSPMDY